jgi:hypothetical protein
VAAVFHRALLTSDVFYERDIYGYWYPHVEVLLRALAEGSAPLWNPNDGFGAPLLSNPALQIAYPPTWLNIAILAPTYYKLFVLGHTAWAGIGTCLLARQLGLGRVPALFAGQAFCLSGPLLSGATLFHHFAGVAWMPWVLFALTRLLARPGLRTTLVLAAVGAAQLLAGSADAILMTALAALVLVASLSGEWKTRPRASPLALRALLAATLGLGLAAVQWLSTAADVTEGSRLRLSATTNLYWSLHPASLLDTLVPGLVAQFPMRDGVRAALFESREPLLSSVYLGAVAAYLALLGLLMRGRLSRGILLGFLFFLTCALGRHAFVLPWLLHVPGFGILRYPIKYLWGASLLWALLVACGASVWGLRWSEREKSWASRVGLVVGVLAGAALAAAAFAWWSPDRLAALVVTGRETATTAFETARRLAIAGATLGLTAGLGAWRASREEPTRPMTLTLGVLLLADLAWAGQPVNHLAPAALLAHRPPFVDEMERGSRIHVIAPAPQWLRAQLARGPAGWAPEWSWALGGIDLLTPPIGSRWGLRGSYDGDFTGLAARSYSDVVALARAAQGTPEGRLVLERGGVQYAVTMLEGELGGLEEADRADSVFVTPLRLLRVPEPLPQAFVLEGVRAVSSKEALAAFADARFDLRREALVDEGEPEASARDGFQGAARVVERRSDALVVEAELNRPGLLVVLEAFRAGWRANVDGAPVPVIRANLIFRGVRLGPGRHRVRMAYRPWAPMIGATISALSVLAWLGLWRSTRPQRPPV